MFTIIAAELLAFLLVLVSYGARDWWQLFIQASLLIQWIVLATSALLCLLRSLLQRVSLLQLVAVVFGIAIGVTLIVSALALHYVMAMPIQEHFYSGVAQGFYIRNLTITAMVVAIALRYLYMQHAWRIKVDAEAGARAQALQARIRPHFLFNSMNIIATLIHDQPKLAEEVIEDLCSLFRASLNDFKQLVSLGEEIELCKRYIRIESLRMGDRLKVNWSLPEDLSAFKIPLLTIQPLLENAVYHGLQPLAEGGEIEVRLALNDASLEIHIQNPISTSCHTTETRGHGLAQDNIKQRLNVHFGSSASFQAYPKNLSYFVELIIPKSPQKSVT